MAEIKIYGTLVNDTNEAIVKSTQVAAVKQDGTAATQSAVNADLYAKYAAVGNAYRVKGSVDSIQQLPELTDNVVGDVWNLIYEFSLGGNHYGPGTNVVWTGSEWDPLGGALDMGYIYYSMPTKSAVTNDVSGATISFKNQYGNEVFTAKINVVGKYGSGLMLATDKAKLDGIAAGAQVNVLESVKVNGTALSVSEKSVNIDLSSYAKSADTIHVADVTATATDMNLKLRKAAGATPICNVTFNAATTSAAGLMSAADKQRLDDAASAKNLEATNLVIKSLGTRITALEAALTLK